MCRLFAQISSKNKNAYDGLACKEFSLLKQSCCNQKNLQKDGWGTAYLQSKNEPLDRWKIIKSPNPIFTEKIKFKKIARESKSKIIIGHIRHASNPKKLPQKELIGLENTQPFSFQNLVFAHNGALNIQDQIADTLGIYQTNIHGTNDSEVLFWLLVKIWKENSAKTDSKKLWGKIFKEMILAIESAWNKIPKNKRKFEVPFRGLNCIVSDGKSLATLCYYAPSKGQSLCGQNRPYFEMCYNISSDMVTIASEPMDKFSEWRPIPTKHILVVDKECSITKAEV